MRNLELDLGAVRCGQRVGRWVKVETTSKCECDDGIGACNETECVGRAVVALRKIAVERIDNRVRFIRYFLWSIPLANARTARVGQNGCANRFKICEKSVSFDCRSNLLGAGSDQQLNFCFETMSTCLTCNWCRTRDVFVWRVGATTDQCRWDIEWPLVCLCCGANIFADLVGAVGGMRAIDEGLEWGQIDQDGLVVGYVVVWS